jgi:ankyrin repeat protein
MKRLAAAMIIGMGLACSGWSVAAPGLPDPAAFSTRLEAGDIEQAKAWLDAGLDPDFPGSRIGSGLMIGAWEGNLELMRLFISRGADINKANANGETPLALAAWNGREQAVKWLLERGARINSPGRQWSALHYAVFGGHRELANFLLAQGADINAQSTNGSTPLMMAIYEGHDDLARALIEKGARRSLKNDWGEGAMEWAMRFNRLGIARLIAESPAEFNTAASEPKEKWGEARRSLKSSKELEQFLRMREILVERGMATEAIDSRIAAERARIVRSEFKREALPPRAATLEITAKRKAPNDQSANIVYSPDGKAQGYKVPPATFSGQARMPPKGSVKPY